MAKRNYVWVVEGHLGDERWRPLSALLDDDGIEQEKHEWRINGWETRVVKYVSTKPAKEVE